MLPARVKDKSTCHACNRLIVSLLACWLFALSCAVTADDARGRVIWRVTDWPPFYLAHGPYRGEGMYDRMIALYQAALPEFTHEELSMTTMRALQQMKNRQHGVAVCHVSMLRSSLSGFAHASELAAILLPHVVIATKQAYPEIMRLAGDESGAVSIEALFLQQSIRGAHSSFGTHKVLEKFAYAETPPPSVTITAENYRNLADLLSNRRVDYIVQYRPFYDAFLADANKDHSEVIIPIAETQDRPYIPTYAGCTKNDIGRAVITGINRVLAENSEALWDTRLRWYPPQDRQTLLSLYKQLGGGSPARPLEAFATTPPSGLSLK